MHLRPVPQAVVPTPSSDARPTFRDIFQSEFSYVWNTLARLGIAPADREDVAHDVFCRVYRQLAEYDPTRPLRPWLFGFAFRVASDYRRLARHRVELMGLEVERAAVLPGADDQLISAEEQKLVESALLMVPIERRAILMLHEIDGESIPTIAAALDVPLNTAYSRLRLARADLASAVKKLQTEGLQHVRP
jgi:RNA polymerase sigma-70 factor (ECF subfamily)